MSRKKKWKYLELSNNSLPSNLPAWFGSADATAICRSKDLWLMKGKHPKNWCLIPLKNHTCKIKKKDVKKIHEKLFWNVDLYSRISKVGQNCTIGFVYMTLFSLVSFSFHRKLLILDVRRVDANWEKRQEEEGSSARAARAREGGAAALASRAKTNPVVHRVY